MYMNSGISENNTFGKTEKLCRNMPIERLFSAGSSFIAYPIRVVYFVESAQDKELQIAQVLVSVSKKKFKRAVKRNRVKRIIKEAYRLNKSELKDSLNLSGKHMDVAFLYLKNELPEYAEIEKSMKKALAILVDKVKGE